MTWRILSCPIQRPELKIIVKYEADDHGTEDQVLEDGAAPRQEAERRPAREQKGFKPYVTKKDGAAVMMSAYKKGYGSDLLQKQDAGQ